MVEIGLYEAMSTLRAVRRHKTDPIPDDVLRRVLTAATWAPSGGNAQPWRIIVVREPALRKRLGELYAERWQVFSRQYRAGLAGLSEPARTAAERTLKAADYLGAHFGNSPIIAIVCFNPRQMAITDADLDRVPVVGGASIYPAVENLLLACRAEGLGCVLTTLLCECEPEVRELLSIPEPWGTAAAIPVGYPRGSGHGPIVRRSVKQLAFLDGWGTPFEI